MLSAVYYQRRQEDMKIEVLERQGAGEEMVHSSPARLARAAAFCQLNDVLGLYSICHV